MQSQYNPVSSSLSKGQKISAAIYLVTNHLSDTDPFKGALRTRAIELLDLPSDARPEVSSIITGLLGAAVLARVVNEKNAGIIIREVSRYGYTSDDHDIAGLFASHTPAAHPDVEMPKMSDTLSLKTTLSINKNNTDKSDRKDKIVSYINDKKSAAIKDISALFPDVSEKTIQRELGSLVSSGKIRKHGSKRWSLYLALTQ